MKNNRLIVGSLLLLLGGILITFRSSAGQTSNIGSTAKRPATASTLSHKQPVTRTGSHSPHGNRRPIESDLDRTVQGVSAATHITLIAGARRTDISVPKGARVHLGVRGGEGGFMACGSAVKTRPIYAVWYDIRALPAGSPLTIVLTISPTRQIVLTCAYCLLRLDRSRHLVLDLKQ